MTGATTDQPGVAERPAREATILVRGGLERSAHGETSEALYLTSGYVYDSAETAEARFAGDDDGYVYSRYGNPTVTMFENRMALLEGAEACYGTASGMAAVFGALFAMLKAGDHIVASRALFGSCYQVITDILARYAVTCELVDGQDMAAWQRALGARKTACVFLETPSNPKLELIDLAGVCALAHDAGAQVVVDNVFATPVLQKPMELGADVVVYSGTKHLDGQGRVLGGAILSSAKFKDDKLKPVLRHTGPALSPFNAWVMLKGMETLKLRVEQSCRSALELAGALEAMDQVARVYYPGLASHPQHGLCKAQMKAGGTLVAFELAGGKAACFAALARLGVIDISNNLGDTRSLITHPATTTHRNVGDKIRAEMGIGDGLLRLSVGIEDVADLRDDLSRALAG